MDKFTQTLEKYVQWIALALAGTWCAFIGVQYGLNTPAMYDPGPGKAKIPAGEVDPQIKATLVDKLDEAIRSADVKKLSKPAQSAKDQFTERMRSEEKSPEFTANWIDSPMPQLLQGNKGPDNNPGIAMTQLPDVVAPTITGVVTVRALVKVPVAAAAPARPGAPAVPVLVAQDRDLVKITAVFDINKQSDNFKLVSTPPNLQVPRFLQVQIVREELLPNGQWGNATTINPPSPINLPQNLPTDAFSQEMFRQWAEKNQDPILRPPYYDVISTMQTVVPVVDTPKGPPPSAPPKTTPKPPTPRPRAQGAYGPTGPVQLAQVTPPSQPPQPSKSIFDEPPAVDNGQPVNPAPQNPAQPNPAPGNPAPQNPGPGDPANPNPNPNPGDVVPNVPQQQLEEKIVVTDDTVQEGKTYRYKVRVIIQNPVFKTVNTTKNLKLLDVFAIPLADAKEQAWSMFSPPVTITSKTKFFVSKPPFRDAKMITLEIFQWQNGQNSRKELDVAPGDTIGTTGWTVVDVRSIVTNNDFQVLLVNDDGTQMVRSYRADSHDPIRAQLKKGGAQGPPGPQPTGIAGR